MRLRLTLVGLVLAFMALVHGRPADPPPVPMHAAGIIRPDGRGGWHLLDDGDHGPHNLASVLVHAGHIEVFFVHPFSKLVTFSIGVDDDLAREHVTAGASTGLSRIGIVLADENGPIAPASVTNTLANIQISVMGFAL
jgi:hypothetical protein